EPARRAPRRPRTPLAHDGGLVVGIDRKLPDELRAEGDARELQRAIQDLRKDAGLALDDRIELWVEGLAEPVAAHLEAVANETLAGAVHRDATSASSGDGVTAGSVDLEAGPARIAIRRMAGGRS